MLQRKHQSPTERLVAAVQQLSLARDIPTVTRIVRTAARQLTGADGATFILKRDEHCFYADEDAIGPLWKGKSFPMETCISGWVMINRQPVVIEDIYADQRIPQEAYQPTFVKSMTMVPIRTLNPIGAIGNYWAKHRVPEPSELALLQALADVTAVTMENIRIYSELEQRVQDRTHELETVNKELQAFSYTVSHDLRAPLRSIQLNLEQLILKNEKTLDESAHHLVGRAMKKASEMKMLIDDLMGFFMMSTSDIERKNLSMKDMVTHIAYDLQEQNPARKIVFCIADLPDARVDETLMKQVWTNLISNAIKYSRYKEESTIEIGTEEKDDNSICYYVKDNGAGFSMKYYDRLFGVFQRLHSKEQFEGSGIGLAIVSRVISKHQGKVWADSVVDEGSTFYFTIA